MPATDGAEPARAAVPAGGRGERVVYIDDDETMMLVASRLLQRAGYVVSAYTDARAAIDALRAAPESVDLVVTDFNMPDCSGLDVAGEIAFFRPDLPVIISSGYLTEDLRIRAAALGVRGLLEKENTFEQLCPIVAQVLAAGS
jgi:DNA-binding NtrC family response regulator